MHNMKKHMLTHSGAKPYSCDFCDKSYTDNYSLKQHVGKVHPDVASTLPHLMITPRTKKQQGTENQDHDRFKSMVNEMTASQKAAALQLCQQTLLAAQIQTDQVQNEQPQAEQTPHLPIGVEPVTYDDNENDVNDDQEFDISQFMEEVEEDASHDENMEEIIEHPESNLINVETENNLKRHVRIHLGIKPYKCKFCEMTFSDKASYMVHIWDIAQLPHGDLCTCSPSRWG